MAVSADGPINEDYLRQSVDFILKARLSPEDYNHAELYMTREVTLTDRRTPWNIVTLVHPETRLEPLWNLEGDGTHRKGKYSLDCRKCRT